MTISGLKKPQFRAVLAVFFAASGAALAASKGPRIDVPERNFSFGRIPNDRGVEHVFSVHNRGDRPLVITSVRTSCGCTAAMMESSVIEPNGAGNLRVNFSPRGAKGSVTRTITIASNDPQTPNVQLSVSAEQVPPEEALPQPEIKRTHERKEKLVFTGDCAKCHLPPKGGLKGRKLYEAVCAKCHGVGGAGVTIDKERLGPPLAANASRVRTREGLVQLISGGTGSPLMPGFGAEYGGPLSSAQVASLADYILKDLRDLSRPGSGVDRVHGPVHGRGR